MINWISETINALVIYGPIGALFLYLLYLINKNTIPSYLKEKGKNLATQEDIQKITSLVEEVKTEHQRLLKQEDREQILKTDVYLKAISSFNSSQLILPSLVNLSIPVEEFVNMQMKNSENIVKVYMTASEETLEKVVNLQISLAKSFSALIPNRYKLTTMLEQIKFKQSSIENLNNKKVSCFDQLDQMLADNKFTSQIGSIKSTIEFCNREIAKIDEELKNENGILNKELLNFNKECQTKYIEVTKTAPDVISALRREINLDIDDNRLKEILKKSTDFLENNIPT